MSGNNIGRQSSNYLKTGKAKVYAQLIDENDVPLSPKKDVGNLESASLSVEREETAVQTGEDDNPAPVRTISRISSAVLNMVCRNHNPLVTIWNMQSEKSNFIQPAVPAGTFESDFTYKVNDFFKLPHEAITAITSITDGNDENPLTQGVHYLVDFDAGIVSIIALPSGVTELAGIKAGYSAAAVTVDDYNGFSQNGVLCKIWIRETAEGPKGLYEFYRCRVNKDGESGIIAADSQDPMTATFAVTIESVQGKPAPGLFRYKKLAGSL